MIELGQILEGLVRRTTEGRLKWSRTVEKDRFISSVDAVSVAIVDAGYVLEADYETRRASYRLDILDEQGDVVDSLGFKDTTFEQQGQLERLYLLARRSALNVESVLEKLAKGLEL